MKRRSDRLQALLLHLLLVPLALLWLAPLWMMLTFATLPDAAIFADRLQLLPGDQLGANLQGLLAGLDFGRAVLNSVGIATLYALISVLLTSMAGYAFARFRFVGKGVLFSLVMATLTVPFFVVVVPQYILVARTLGLADTWVAVIVPPLFNSLGVLFMRQIFQSLPQELLEAARIDGAGEVRIFFRIALPLVLPGMAALGIILFLASWNNYLWPLLVAADRTVVTAPVALGRLIGLTQVSWGGIMAGASILTVPMVVVFLLLQRHFVAGITAGAVK